MILFGLFLVVWAILILFNRLEISLNLSSDGYAPLMMAVLKRNKEIIELLLGAGANVNTADATGDTALMKAVALGETEVASFKV